MDRVVVPADPGAFSAYGGLCSAPFRERMATVLEPLDGGALEAVRELGARFEQALAREFESDGLGGDGLRFRYEVDARYFGQYHEITIAVPKGAGRAAVQRLFEEKFLREFGRLDAGRSVELVNFRLIGEAPVRIPALARAGGCFADTAAAAATRPVFVRDGFADCPVFQRAALGAGARLAGPLILEEMSATLFVPPGWRLGGGTCGGAAAHPGEAKSGRMEVRCLTPPCRASPGLSRKAAISCASTATRPATSGNARPRRAAFRTAPASASKCRP